MSSPAVFQGSKRAGRVSRLESKEARKFKRNLRTLRTLARRLTSIYELDVYLRGIDNLEMREASRKLILHFRPDLAR